MSHNGQVLDVGWGEMLLLAVVALLIFGPEKLPKAAADAGRLVRKLREMAQSAQSDLGATGIDVEGIKNDLKSATDLHPKRIMASVMEPLNTPPTPQNRAVSAPKPDAAAAGPNNATGTSDGTLGDASTGDATATPKPAAPPISSRIDPDAT